MSWFDKGRGVARHLDLQWGDVTTLAGSALTQTRDKPRSATERLRPYTVDASSIPELGENFDPPKRKRRRKPGRPKGSKNKAKRA